MTNVTITRPGKYTNGTPCYVTENRAYKGIVGYGTEIEESQASFEAARAAYEKLVPPQKTMGATVSMTMFRPVTVIRGIRPAPALAGA